LRAHGGEDWVAPGRSNFRALRQLEGIFDVDAALGSNRGSVD